MPSWLLILRQEARRRAKNKKRKGEKMEKTSFKTSIVIEGDITTKVVENRQKKSDGTETISQTRVSVKTEDWFNTIKTELTPPFQCVMPAMPIGSRIAAMAKTGDRSVYIVELQPTIRSIIEKKVEEERLFKLSFPFVVMIQRFVGNEMNGSPFIFYRNEPIFGEGDLLSNPNLPNINSDYSVCWGSSSSISSSQPVNVKLATICQIFWQSQFNKDLIGNFWEPSQKFPGHPQSFEEWEKMTTADPSFILKINWPSSSKKISDILEWGVK